MIGHKGEQAVTVRALRGAAPYIHMYKGKVFVIKTGGGAFRDAATMRAFVAALALAVAVPANGEGSLATLRVGEQSARQGVLLLGPRLHLRDGWIFQPAKWIGHDDAMQGVAGVDGPRRGVVPNREHGAG